MLNQKGNSVVNKKFWLAISVVAGTFFISELTGVTALLARHSSSTMAGGGVNAKTLMVCSSNQPSGFDIAQYTDAATIESSVHVFDRLVVFQKGSTDLGPSLAKSWTVSQDGLTYTFHLRRGVPFHTTDYFKPTRDFNADDVVFTFERMRNPKHPFNVAYPAEFPYFVAMGLDKNLRSVKKLDDHTVQFVLKEINAPFIQNIAMEFASILSAEYANQLLHQGKAEQINQKPIGTGPFMLKSYKRNQQIRYVAHKAYWDQRKENGPRVDQIVISLVKETMVNSKKMLAGECHLATLGAIPLTEIKRFEQHPKFVVHKQPGFETWLLSYNTQKPYLSKAQVRQALDMALDKAAMLKTGDGLIELAHNLMPPSQWSYDPSIKKAAYDPIRAKQLLKQAGYPNGFALKLFINLGRSPLNDRLAAMIQADWKKIGVRVQLVTYDGGEFWKRAAAGEHDVIFSGWQGDNGDPDNWLSSELGCSAIGGSNHARWCHAGFNQLLLKALRCTNHNERIKLYQAAQKIIQQEVPISPLYYRMALYVYSKAVKFERPYIIPAIGADEYVGIALE
ncbi:MAG: ABC transporter substrate-binding protein [Neisseriales bacterium]|nr:MAG: ABC transporter substrate-binding protein [Neisseriales bacterium]